MVGVLCPGALEPAAPATTFSGGRLALFDVRCVRRMEGWRGRAGMDEAVERERDEARSGRRAENQDTAGCHEARRRRFDGS